MLLGLNDDTIDVGIHMCIGGVEVAYYDTDHIGPSEISRRAKALFDILDVGSHTLSEVVGDLPLLVPHLEQHHRVLKSMDLEQFRKAFDPIN